MYAVNVLVFRMKTNKELTRITNDGVCGKLQETLLDSLTCWLYLLENTFSQVVYGGILHRPASQEAAPSKPH